MLLYTYTTTDMWQYVHHSLRSNTSKMMMTPTTTCAFGRAAVRHNKPAGGSSSLLADRVPRCDVDTQYALASSARVRPSSRRKFRPQKCMIDRAGGGGRECGGQRLLVRVHAVRRGRAAPLQPPVSRQNWRRALVAGRAAARVYWHMHMHSQAGDGNCSQHFSANKVCRKTHVDMCLTHPQLAIWHGPDRVALGNFVLSDLDSFFP